MSTINNKKLTLNAQTLRQNMTKEERHLWYDFLKTLPVTVNRQKVIGNYIVDFCISSSKLIIELDGSQHYEDNGKKEGTLRDAKLKEMGFTVLRYSNLDINGRFNEVCQDIFNFLESKK